MNYDVTTVIWVLVATALIYFMQAGFALCEAGLTRAKNTGNILMKNLMDFCIGTPCYWLVGFGIMFGSTAPLVGRLDPMIRGIYTAEQTVVPQTMRAPISRLTACTRPPYRFWSIRSEDTGPGAAAGCPAWDFMISPAAPSFTMSEA